MPNLDNNGNVIAHDSNGRPLRACKPIPENMHQNPCKDTPKIEITKSDKCQIPLFPYKKSKIPRIYHFVYSTIDPKIKNGKLAKGATYL